MDVRRRFQIPPTLAVGKERPRMTRQQRAITLQLLPDKEPLDVLDALDRLSGQGGRFHLVMGATRPRRAAASQARDRTRPPPPPRRVRPVYLTPTPEDCCKVPSPAPTFASRRR